MAMYIICLAKPAYPNSGAILFNKVVTLVALTEPPESFIADSRNFTQHPLKNCDLGS